MNFEINNTTIRKTYYGNRVEELENNITWIFHPILISFGLSANVIAGTIIAGNKSMHTSSNCYVFSIITSDLVILSDITFQIFRKWFVAAGTSSSSLSSSMYFMKFDVSYIDCVTLEATILTIVIFALERYVASTSTSTSTTTNDISLSKKSQSFSFSNGIKTVLIIWSLAATFPAMELNLNLHFLPDTQASIFFISTTMFLLLPTFLIIILAIFTLIFINDGNFNQKSNPDATKVFLSLTVVFYVSMAPYRILSLVRFIYPTLCCSQTILNTSYLIVELSAAVNPILYGFVSNNFRTAFKETLTSFCGNKNEQRTVDPCRVIED